MCTWCVYYTEVCVGCRRVARAKFSQTQKSTGANVLMLYIIEYINVDDDCNIRGAVYVLR